MTRVSDEDLDLMKHCLARMDGGIRNQTIERGYADIARDIRDELRALREVADAAATALTSWDDGQSPAANLRGIMVALKAAGR